MGEVERRSGRKQANKLGKDFFITEFFVFLSQVFVFFSVAVFASKFLTNEDDLVEFANSKVNVHTLPELGYTLLAITVTFGILSIITYGAPRRGLVARITFEVLNEYPRVIYLFGSSVTATMFAVAIFISMNPHSAPKPPVFFFWAALYSLTIFVYGCGIKMWLICRAVRVPTI